MSRSLSRISMYYQLVYGSSACLGTTLAFPSSTETSKMQSETTHFWALRVVRGRLLRSLIARVARADIHLNELPSIPSSALLLVARNTEAAQTIRRIVVSCLPGLMSIRRTSKCVSVAGSPNSLLILG